MYDHTSTTMFDENFNPHTAIVITDKEIKIVQDLAGIGN